MCSVSGRQSKAQQENLHQREYIPAKEGTMGPWVVESPRESHWQVYGPLNSNHNRGQSHQQPFRFWITPFNLMTTGSNLPTHSVRQQTDPGDQIAPSSPRSTRRTMSYVSELQVAPDKPLDPYKYITFVTHIS